MLTNLLREYDANRIFLSSVGLWPFQNRITRNFLRTFCFLLETSIYYFEILSLYDFWNDAQIVFEGCYYLMISTLIFVTMWNEFFNDDKFRKLYETIDEHWNTFTTDLENRILKSYSLISRKVLIYFSIVGYSCTVTYMFIPLMPIFLDLILPLNETRPRQLTIKVSEFRLNKDENFTLIFCYTYIVLVIGITILIGVDAMHVSCTNHACSLFASVSQQIQNINLAVYDKKETNGYGCKVNIDFESSNEEAMYRKYITCLKKHQLALEFVGILDSTYQELFLAILLLLGGTLTLLAIQIVYTLNQLEEMIRLVFDIFAIMIVLMSMCYSSQRIIDESQNVFYQAYEAEWYNYSPRLKSLLIVLLYRSNVPCGLKAGGMISLSVKTFTSVVQMAVSYFTTFLSVKG